MVMHASHKPGYPRAGAQCVGALGLGVGGGLRFQARVRVARLGLYG